MSINTFKWGFIGLGIGSRDTIYKLSKNQTFQSILNINFIE